MFRMFVVAALALSAPVFATPLYAQDAPTGSISVSGGVELVSDYRYRGISLSDGDLAVQPTVTLSHDSGFYVGAWGSNIDDGPTYGDIETNIYGGYATDIAPGLELDAGLVYYWYPGGKKAFGPSDYGEGVVKLSYALGPAELTGTAAYAWDQAALGDDDNLYLGLGLSTGIPTTPVTLSAAAGRSDGAFAPGGRYWDWSVGASTNFGPVRAGIKYVDTDIRKTGIKAIDRRYNATVVLSLGVSF